MKTYVSFIIFGVLAILDCHAQVLIKGQVITPEKQEIVGATIIEKDTKNSAITNVRGHFELNCSVSHPTLKISCLGYNTKSVVIRDDRFVVIQLDPKDVMLNEAVVVGYAKQKKATLTGAVSTVSAEKINKRPIASLSNALQGTMPGVTIRQRSGQPGSDGASIHIRGIGSINSDQQPLILIDGIEMDINQLDPNIIENISVLKDAASASIYGSRASNGVILITTKRGKQGRITTTYNSFCTFQMPTNLPEPVSAWEYLQAELNSWDNAGMSITEIQRDQQQKLIEEQKTLPPDNLNRYNTDWKKETLKKYSMMHSHNIGISGGNEKLSFYGSGTFLSQGGLIPNDKFIRANLHANTDIKINSFTKLSLEAYLRQSEIKNPGLGSPKSIINQALYMLPTLSAAKELDGNWGYGKNGLNPTAIANASGERISKTSDLLLSAGVTLNPFKGLEIKGLYSRKTLSTRDRSLVLPYTTSLKGQIMGNYPAEDGLNESWSETIKNYYLLQSSYELNLKEHFAKILIGMQAEDNEYEGFHGTKKNFELGKYYLNNGDDATATTGGGSVSWSMLSYFGRINYNYQQKYLLELTGRFDGSSRFIRANRWGFFPSISAGWIISQEDFLSSTSSYLDLLKLRISYGLLGNQNIGYYPYAAVIEPGYGYYLGDNKELMPGVAQIYLANQNIGWEKSKQFDIGIDLSLWKGLLSLNTDFYVKNVYDMLMRFPNPYFVGMLPAFTNAGDMVNKGWEIGLSHKNKIGKLKYDITFTLNDNRNKITDLHGLNSQDKTLVENYPSGGLWGYVTDGYYKDWDDVKNSPKISNAARPGFVKYKKMYHGEGIDPMLIDSRDMIYLGDPFPHFEYGFNTNLKYNAFDFTLFFQGVGKCSKYMSGIGIKPFANGANLFKHQLDSWTPSNLNAKYPILVPESNAANNFIISDKWIMNAAYCRLKNIVIGYTLPESITRKIKVNSIRTYVSAQNLFTLSNVFDGYDPEVSYGGAQGGEFYPVMKTFTMGIDVKF